MYFRHQITPDLSLALPQPSMAQELFELTDKNRDHLSPWLDWVKYTLEVQDSLNYITKSLTNFSQSKSLPLVIIYKDEIAGIAGFIFLDHKNKNAEIGYWLGHEFTSKGIMKLCVNALLEYGFSDLGLNRIQIRCSHKNLPSQNVAKKSGFMLEATLKGEHKVEEEFEDTLIFRILRNEWTIH